jgi:AsmA family protein
MVMPRAIVVAGAVILAVVAVIIGLIVATVATILAVYDANDRKQLAASAASTALGRKVSINGDADLDLGWVTRIRLGDVSIANADWAKANDPNMVQVGQLDFAIDVWQLLHGRFLVSEVDISRPRVLLEKNAKGEANWQFSTAAKAAAHTAAPTQRKEVPVVQHLQLDQGRFVYNDAKINRDATLDVSRLRVTDDRADRKVQVTGDGQYKIQVKGEAQGQGGPFAIRFFGDPWEQLQASDKPYPVDVDLRLGDLQVKTSGTVTDPVQLEGLDLKLDVRGDNTANLFAISGIALPPSPPYRFSGNVDHRGTEWRLTDGSGRMGGSDMRGTVGVDTGRERLMLKADLVSDNLLAKDLGPFIGARPGGKEGEQAAANKSEAAGRADGKVLPDKEIDLGRLKAMDADLAFKANHIDIPILPFDRLETKMTLDAGTLKLQPAVIRIGDGTVRTNLSLYGSEKPVRVDIDTQIERVDLKQFLRGSRLVEQTAGILGGRVQLRATGRSVAQILGTANGQVFVVSSGGEFSHLLIELAGLDIAHSLQVAIEGDEPIPIRCIVADLPAKDGVFSARTLIFDTTKTIVQGRGTINMRDETADLTITPVPKDFSPLSLRSPISLQGTFANPSVFTDPVGLGVNTTMKKIVDAVLTAAVGLAPPIDEGVGKDSDCNALIQQARAQSPTREPR